MPNPWLEGIQVGAQIAERRFDQSARTQQLKLQQAQRQMQERTLAAQAQMYLEHANLYRQQAEQDKSDSFLLKAAGDKIPELVEKYKALGHADEAAHEMAVKEAVTPLMFVSPSAFQKVASGISAMTRADASGKAPFTPSIEPLKDSAGNTVDVLRSGPNSAVQVRAPATASTGATAAMKDIAQANELITQANAREAAGDIEGAKALREDAVLLKGAHTKSGMTIETNPDGTFRITQGVAGAKVPMGVAVKVAERLSQTEKAIDNLDDLDATLRPQDVGFKGVLGELFLDKILPQLGTSTADVKRMDNRTKLRTLAENLMRQVSADSRFSNADRDSISKILPSVGVVESFDHTKQVISTLRKIFAKRALIDAKENNQAPPEFAVRTLDDEGLIEASNNGLLTQEQAISAYRKRRGTP